MSNLATPFVGLPAYGLPTTETLLLYVGGGADSARQRFDPPCKEAIVLRSARKKREYGKIRLKRRLFVDGSTESIRRQVPDSDLPGHLRTARP